MKEVSCRVLDMFFREAQARGIPWETLTAGVPYSLKALRHKQERMDWEHFVLFMHNVGSVWSHEELIQLGIGFYLSPYMKPFSSIARAMLSAQDFYRWLFSRSNALVSHVFSCIEPKYKAIDATHLELELHIAPGFAHCPEFFVVSKGNFIGMPRILGLPLAQVEMQMSDRSARYQVVVPPGGGWFRMLRKLAMLPFDARSAVNELEEAQLALECRQTALETVRGGLAQRTKELETLTLLGRSLTAHTDMDTLSDAVVQLIQERFGFVGVGLWLSVKSDFKRLKECGAIPSTPPQTFLLRQGGKVVGRLEVWVERSQSPRLASASDRMEPLPIEAALPWIAMALENVRSSCEAWRSSGCELGESKLARGSPHRRLRASQAHWTWSLRRGLVGPEPSRHLSGGQSPLPVEI